VSDASGEDAVMLWLDRVERRDKGVGEHRRLHQLVAHTLSCALEQLAWVVRRESALIVANADP